MLLSVRTLRGPTAALDSKSMPELAPALLLSARERVIVALDFPSAQPALGFLANLNASCPVPPRWVKVGLELFLAEGPALVRQLREKQYSVFLDLKLHDIPNTVAAAVRAASALDADLLTIHAAGGPAMLAAAADCAAATNTIGRAPRLLAVTVLTSMDQAQLAAIGVDGSPAQQVLRLARQAREAGIGGLVASPLEASALRHALGPETHLVTPGIRPAGEAAQDDQQRIATPAAALAAGANQLVIGRPVTRALNPVAAWDAILHEIAEMEALLQADAKKPG